MASTTNDIERAELTNNEGTHHTQSTQPTQQTPSDNDWETDIASIFSRQRSLTTINTVSTDHAPAAPLPQTIWNNRQRRARLVILPVVSALVVLATVHLVLVAVSTKYPDRLPEKWVLVADCVLLFLVASGGIVFGLLKWYGVLT